MLCRLLRLAIAAWMAIFAASAPAAEQQTRRPSMIPGGKMTLFYVGPADVLATAGTPAIAAHSMWRKLLAVYTGGLFQVELPSGASRNIGALKDGYVDLVTLNSFCGPNNVKGCTISEIYDQTSNGNGLPQANLANQCKLAFTHVSAASPAVPYAECGAAHWFRNRTHTSRMPTGAQSITEYMIVATGLSNACCGTYGDMEASVADTGNGHMFALSYSTGAEGVVGSGKGPWPGVDLENGVYLYGNAPASPYLTVLGKYRNASATWQLKSSDPTKGSFSILNDSPLPARYAAHWEGGLSLGEGGDGTPAPINFIEGAVVAAATLDATDNALQSNIVGSFAATSRKPP